MKKVNFIFFFVYTFNKLFIVLLLHFHTFYTLNVSIYFFLRLLYASMVKNLDICIIYSIYHKYKEPETWDLFLIKSVE